MTTYAKAQAEPYRRVELATPLREAWLYHDGSITIGEVFGDRMGHGGQSLHIDARDVRHLLSSLGFEMVPSQLRERAQKGKSR